ncbi:MAG: hypothetical protein AB1634_10100 [Thermodesulfobacteriota bacterium]
MKRTTFGVAAILIAASLPVGCLANDNSGAAAESRMDRRLLASAAARPGPAETAAARPLAESGLPDSSQVFAVESLPDVILVNPVTMEQSTADMQPRLKYLKITGLRLAEDGKTVEFSIENDFNRTNAQAVRLGGLMVTGLVRYDSDGGAELHSTVLFRDKRVVLEKGSTQFRSNPATYPHVTRIEKLQFFITPPKENLVKAVAAANPQGAPGMPDTSQVFPVASLPPVIEIDPSTIEQHAAVRDPRLGYLRITGLRLAGNGTALEFNVENTFDRQKSEEPIHVGGLMVTGMARYAYDDGAALHSCVLLEEKRLAFRKGANVFQTDPAMNPDLRRIESVQFFLTPE